MQVYSLIPSLKTYHPTLQLNEDVNDADLGYS